MINSIFATVIGSESKDNSPTDDYKRLTHDNQDVTQRMNRNEEEGKQNDGKTENADPQLISIAPDSNNNKNEWLQVATTNKHSVDGENQSEQVKNRAIYEMKLTEQEQKAGTLEKEYKNTMEASSDSINNNNNGWTKVINKRKASPIAQNTKQARLQENKSSHGKAPPAATSKAKANSPKGDNNKPKIATGGATGQQGAKSIKTGSQRVNKKNNSLTQTKLETTQGNKDAIGLAKTGNNTTKKTNHTKNTNINQKKTIKNKNTPQNNRTDNNRVNTNNKSKGYIHHEIQKWELRTFDDTEGRKPDGRPSNLETDETMNQWIQGYSICCAGPYCVISQPKKLSVHNRCASCGWCMHRACSVPWKRTATQSKENIYTPTTTINSFCRFCVASNHMKLEKAGTDEAYVSTRYEAVRKHVRTDWDTIRLGSLMEEIDLNSDSPDEPRNTAENNLTTVSTQNVIHDIKKIHSKEATAMEVDDDVATVTAANETAVKEQTFPPTQEAMTTKYLDIQLQIQASTSDDAMEPLNKLADKLRRWMNGVQQICPSFKLHTVDPKHENQATLHVIDELDWKKLSDIKQYFRGAQPKPKGGRSFLRVKASFDMTLTDFLGNIEWYHQNQNERIQEASLQCFQSEILGYLLYSLRSTDADAIKQALSEAVGKPLSVRFMRINDGAKYEENRDTSKDPKALHIECDKEDAEAIYSRIRMIYGTKQKKFPLGIKFRFVPYRNRLLDIQSLSKYEILRIRQDNWCRQYCAIMRDDVMGLDGKISRTGKTLREAIMSIPAQNGNKMNSLVFSIDKRWRLPGLNFTFHPDKAQEGAMMVKGLVPRLVHMFSEEQIRPFFTPEAFAAGITMEYDPATGNVKSAADFDLEDILAEDDEMASLKPQRAQDSETAETGFGQRVSLVKERSDEDTISTFNDGNNKSNTTVETTKATIPPSEIEAEAGSTGSESTTSSLSLATKATMSTRISSVESKFEGMSDQVKDVKQDLAEMSQLLNLMCTNMGIQHADNDMGKTMVSPDRHSGKTNTSGVTNPQIQSFDIGIIPHPGNNPAKG